MKNSFSPFFQLWLFWDQAVCELQIYEWVWAWRPCSQHTVPHDWNYTSKETSCNKNAHVLTIQSQAGTYTGQISINSPAEKPKNEEREGCDVTLVPDVFNVKLHPLNYSGRSYKKRLRGRSRFIRLNKCIAMCVNTMEIVHTCRISSQTRVKTQKYNTSSEGAGPTGGGGLKSTNRM